MRGPAKTDDQKDGSEALESVTLKRLLSTPPQPKPKKDASASPKKRGRPKKGGADEPR